MFYLAGIVYALAFWAVCWKRPQLALMLIFALAPFQNDIGQLNASSDPNDPSGGGGDNGAGPHFSIAEINLMLTAMLFVFKRRPVLFGPALVPTLLYFAVCTCSSLVTWRGTTLNSMIQMGLYLIVAVAVFTSMGRDERDFRLSFYGLLAIGTLLASFVLVTRSGYVLGLHKNGVGGSLSCAVIVGTELWLAAKTPRSRLILTWILGILVAGLFFSLSRGGWIGAGVGIILILAMRRQFRMLVKVLCAFVPLICLCWALLPQQSRSYTTGLTQENWNIRMRYNSVEVAKGFFAESPILGDGVGLRKEYDATNLFWLTLAETGVPGVITFLALQFAILRMVWKTQRKLSRTEPLYSAVAIGGALILGRLVHGMVDHYWSRGAITIAWAGVGMATYGYLVVRHREAHARALRRLELLSPEEGEAQFA